MASITNARGSFGFGPVLGSMDQYIVGPSHPLKRTGRIRHTFLHVGRYGAEYLWTTPDGERHGSLATAEEHVARDMDLGVLA